MDTVGIRELKTHLSRHLRRVRAGTPLAVTEHGRTIATITSADHGTETPDLAWARAIVSDGRAHWSGGKPLGLERPVALASGPPLADTVLEDRR